MVVKKQITQMISNNNNKYLLLQQNTLLRAHLKNHHNLLAIVSCGSSESLLSSQRVKSVSECIHQVGPQLALICRGEEEA